MVIWLLTLETETSGRYDKRKQKFYFGQIWFFLPMYLESRYFSVCFTYSVGRWVHLNLVFFFFLTKVSVYTSLSFTILSVIEWRRQRMFEYMGIPMSFKWDPSFKCRLVNLLSYVPLNVQLFFWTKSHIRREKNRSWEMLSGFPWSQMWVLRFVH